MNLDLLVRPGRLSGDSLSLVLNGYKAIESYTYHQSICGTIFLEENILLFVTEGAVNIRYGKLDYTVNKNQMAFLITTKLTALQFLV